MLDGPFLAVLLGEKRHSKIVLSQFSGMIGDYAAAWMPSVFVPLLALGFFVGMGILFNVVEASD